MPKDFSHTKVAQVTLIERESKKTVYKFVAGNGESVWRVAHLVTKPIFARKLYNEDDEIDMEHNLPMIAGFCKKTKKYSELYIFVKAEIVDYNLGLYNVLSQRSDS